MTQAGRGRGAPRRLGVLLASVTATAAGLAAVAPAAGAAERCYDIDATGTGSVTSAPGSSPTTTVARISDGGLLQGTTTGSFSDGSLPGTFTGPVTFTTNKGTLTVTLNGSFPTETTFVGEGDVTSSSGKLADASGHLAFDGVITDASGAFTETVTGQICVDPAR